MQPIKGRLENPIIPKSEQHVQSDVNFLCDVNRLFSSFIGTVRSQFSLHSKLETPSQHPIDIQNKASRRLYNSTLETEYYLLD